MADKPETLDDWLAPPAKAASPEPSATAAPSTKAESLDDWLAPPAHPTTTVVAPPATTGIGIGGGPAESAADTLKRWFGGGGPPAKSSPLADVITSPDALAADRPAGEAPPSQSDFANALQPAPNTTYGSQPWMWVARDDKTGQYRFAMPTSVRDVLSGNVGPATTVDPDTGQIQYGMTPGADLLLSAGARPLRFSGASPLMPPPSPTFGGPLPPTAAELIAAVQRAGETTPRMAAELEARLRANAATAQPAAAGPQSTGAQVTPTAATQMTPEEIATQRTVADKQWLNQTQQPGVQDTTEHIPGITPNLVEQEQTVTAARELKALKNLNPELSQAEREILDRNTDLRKGFYADTVGSDVTRAADLKAANDKINTDLANVWQGKGEANPANVHTQIQTELAGSAGDLPPLKSAMKQVSDSLENAGTDPEAMYRTHRLINYLQSRQGQLENPGYGAADVQAALTRTKGALAKTIDDAAPGFGKAMSDYAGARGPIDAAKALQDRENGLYDSRGNMSFLKVHGLVRDIIDAQKWDAPNDPLAGVSDAQMARLKALHDDLKRVASAKDLATAQGSDTAMNAVDMAKQYGKLAGRAGVEWAANRAFGPGVGSMIVRGAENLLRPITSGIAARQQIRRGMEILQPAPTNNPLQPP